MVWISEERGHFVEGGGKRVVGFGEEQEGRQAVEDALVLAFEPLSYEWSIGRGGGWWVYGELVVGARVLVGR